MILYFVPYIFSYTNPVTSFPADKLVSVFFTILTHMLNHIIYTLRYMEVKNAMRNLSKWRVTQAVYNA